MKRAEQTAADWRRLRESPHWRDIKPPQFPDLRPTRVTIEPADEAEPDRVERRLAAFKARAGWIERQSGTAFFGDGASVPAPAGDFDAIIGAELAGEDESLSVRVVADGWRLTHIRDQDDPTGDHLCHDMVLAGVDRLPASGQTFGRTLHYRVYWRHDAEFGWRQVAARLLGFEGGEP